MIIVLAIDLFSVCSHAAGVLCKHCMCLIGMILPAICCPLIYTSVFRMISNIPEPMPFPMPCSRINLLRRK